MADLRGGSTVGGRPILGKEARDNYLGRIVGNKLKESIIYDDGSKVRVNGSVEVTGGFTLASNNVSIYGTKNDLINVSLIKVSTSNKIEVGDVTVPLTIYSVSTPMYNDGVASFNILTTKSFNPTSKLDATAKAVDSDKLDGIDSASFLRSDASDDFGGGVLRVLNTAGIDITTSTSTINGLQVFQSTAGADALMTFHISNDYAVHFGLDGDTNDLTVGGFSMGANKYKIWHQGNDGANSGLDADLLDGLHASDFLRATANAVSASKLATARTITLGGLLSGSASFDGSANITLSANTLMLENRTTDPTSPAIGTIWIRTDL